MKTETELIDEIRIATDLMNDFEIQENYGKMNKLQGYIEGLQFGREYNRSCIEYMKSN